MHIAIELVSLVATVIAVTGLCTRFDLPSPLVLIAVGIGASYLPFVPEVHLQPEVVLFGLLPPLLYSAAMSMSLVDFNANRRSILLLSIGLVIFTTAGVAVVVHALLPDLKWGVCFAIGAVVAPPDAVAATAIGRRIGLPRRIVTILEGESLLNDATALVALRTSIAAAALTVTWQGVTKDFVIAAGGGVIVGLIAFVIVGVVRKRITDTQLDSGLSFVTPFAAYVAAEEIHASGVIAVVVAGLLLGHKAPILQTAQSRIAETMNWRAIGFLLESAVFLLIGLQARWIIGAVEDGNLAWGRVIAVCSATLAAVIALRMVWVFATRYLLIHRTDDGSLARRPLSFTILLGWAGMRGVVTLAAAFVIPAGTPHRSTLLLIAFTVTAGTLFIQGLSLPWLAKRLKVPSPDPVADAVARASLINQASIAGFAELDKIDEDDPHNVIQSIRDRVERRDFAVWERIGVSESETPSETYARLRKLMIDAERGRVLEIRDTGTVDHEVVEQVLAMLDVEESMLDFSQSEQERLRTTDSSLALEGGCEDLRRVWPPVHPDAFGVCPDCVEEGTAWVHLRMCRVCGHVGCCDSSPRRHASLHFEATGHPVMRSIEPGEDWRWCFIHQITG